MGTMTESAKALLPELIKIRRDFHEYPELSGKEEETAKKVAAYLKEMGCDQVIEHVGGHGVIGVIKGASEGGVVALRADMDALQIQEMNETEYRSRNDGVMHACGHDNHMTGLLGAAKLLLERRDQIHGTVKLVFQPAEELSPVGGSRGMLEAGYLDDAKAVYGLHVWPDLPHGKVGVKALTRWSWEPSLLWRPSPSSAGRWILWIMRWSHSGSSMREPGITSLPESVFWTGP